MDNTIINIGFNCSNEYAYITGVAIASILKNANIDDNIHIVILHKDIPIYKQNLIKSLTQIRPCTIEFRLVDNKVFADYKNLEFGTGYEYSNYRLKIASICNDLDKIIFLDSDVLVMKSLSLLWNLDIANYHIAAVCDFGRNVIKNYTLKDKDRFPNISVNTGVLLCNLKKWREDNSEEKIRESYKWYIKNYAHWPDQQALNITFKNSIYYLETKYNLGVLAYINHLYDDEDEFLNGIKESVILHYCGAYERPWLCPSAFYAAEWWQIARLTPFYEALLVYACDYKGLFMIQDLCNKLVSVGEDLHIKISYAMCKVFKFLPFEFIKKKYQYYKNKHDMFKSIKNNNWHCHNYRYYY